MISMKTPDGIKKGLECCNTGKSPACEICSYKSFELGPHGVHYVNYHCKQLQIDALAYIQQLELERDELLKDLRATDPCDNCKHCGDNCKDCEEDEHWEWRGVKEETP